MHLMLIGLTLKQWRSKGAPGDTFWERQIVDEKLVFKGSFNSSVFVIRIPSLKTW